MDDNTQLSWSSVFVRNSGVTVSSTSVLHILLVVFISLFFFFFFCCFKGEILCSDKMHRHCKSENFARKPLQNQPACAREEREQTITLLAVERACAMQDQNDV